MIFSYKLYKNLLVTVEGQEEVLTKPEWSYLFALKKIPGSDIKALQAKACEDPWYAYLFARYISGADIKYCQEHACKNTRWAYYFAIDIPGADKEYCFKHAFPEEKHGPDRWKSEYNKFIMKKACE